MQHFGGRPINTASGNYNYQMTDFDITAVGQPLQFERSYNSNAITGTAVYTLPLGYGWTHNHDIELTFPSSPGGEPGTVILKAPHGSRMRFMETGNGSYSPYPGVWATLTRTLITTNTYVYTATAGNQETFVFNNAGQLTRRLDAQGNASNYSYNASLRLSRVTDAGSGRYLDFGYNAQGLLTSVTDSTGRQVRYTYNSNDLTRVVDTRNFTWTYRYSGTTHLLREVEDPTAKILERTFFDAQYRAYRQENGAGQPILQINYLGSTRVITDMGQVMTDTYNAQGLWVGQSDAQAQNQSFNFDTAFNRTKVIDARGNPITYTRTSMGYTTAMTDALNNRTSFGYSNDSRNNLTSITDARNNTISYTYDISNNLKTITTVSGTIVYTYNSRSQVTQLRDEKQQLTQYGYDSVGNLTAITDTLNNKTTLAYDSLGRLTRLTDARGNQNRFGYDNDGPPAAFSSAKTSTPAI
jgi:YD repeat-containing protein